MPRRPTKKSLASEARGAQRIHRDVVDEDDVKAAIDIIRRDYWQDVRGIGDSLKEEIRRREITSREQFEERLHQDVDGSGRVIYTMQAMLGLVVSDNSDEYQEQMGEVPVDGDSINYAAMMSYALQADVLGYIGDVDDLFPDSDEDD